jgi:hypothetical protein
MKRREMERWMRDALENAESDLVKLVLERAEITRSILALKPVVDSLRAIADEPPMEIPSDLRALALLNPSETSDESKLSFVDAIRAILQATGNPLTAPEIRDALIARGYKVAKYAQPLVPVHNTLTRLVSKGEVDRVQLSETQVGYRWVPVLRRFRSSAGEIGPHVAAAAARLKATKEGGEE